MFGLKRCSTALRASNKLISRNVRSFSVAKEMQLVQPTIAVDYDKLFINGKFVDSVSGKTMPTVDPRNGNTIVQVAEAQKEDIDVAVKASRAAFESGVWASLSGFERSKVLYKIADLIVENKETLKQLETWDNGKPLTSADGDMYFAEEVFRYYAGWADKISGKTIPCNSLGGQKKFAYTLHEPIGVVGAIIPWNFPLLMMAWQVAPSLATGNAIVVKAAESTPLTALYLAKLCSEAGVPDGIVNVTPGYGETAGAALASHPGIDKVSFTGETGTGKLVMQEAATNITPVTLELGGKSPLIICDDADIDAAVASAQVGLFLNQGQCCCASSRIYVQDNVYDEFVEKTVKETEKRRVGDPFTDVDQGPQQNEEQFNKVMGYIKSGKKEGATLLTGGNQIGNDGYFVQPTVFGDVKDNMSISREEIFGPVMQIARFSDLDSVIKRSNDTTYGLAAGIFSKNVDTINRVTRELKAGTIWVNCYDVFDASLPFGGYKKSGIGRIKGEYALENFTQVKAIVQNMTNDGGWY